MERSSGKKQQLSHSARHFPLFFLSFFAQHFNGLLLPLQTGQKELLSGPEQARET